MTDEEALAYATAVTRYGENQGDAMRRAKALPSGGTAPERAQDVAGFGEPERILDNGLTAALGGSERAAGVAGSVVRGILETGLEAKDLESAANALVEAFRKDLVVATRGEGAQLAKDRLGAIVWDDQTGNFFVGERRVLPYELGQEMARWMNED